MRLVIDLLKNRGSNTGSLTMAYAASMLTSRNHHEVIYFTFKGTPAYFSSLGLSPDIQEDTCYNPKVVNIGKVHAQILTFFVNNLRLPIHRALSCTSYRTIVFQGHSLGGAYATLAAAYFSRLCPAQVHCVTYGAPKVGDKTFCKLFKKYVSVSYRVVNDQDPITKHPWTRNYCHVHGKVKHKLKVPIGSPHRLENYVLIDTYDSTHLGTSLRSESQPWSQPESQPWSQRTFIPGSRPASIHVANSVEYDIPMTPQVLRASNRATSHPGPGVPLRMGVSSLANLKSTTTIQEDDKPDGLRRDSYSFEL